MNLEVRSTPTTLLTGSTGLVRGRAAVFGVPGKVATPNMSFIETLHPGAFDESVQGGDVRLLHMHERMHLLARTKSGTLRLSSTAAGLDFESDLPDTTLGRDVLVQVRRGDISGMSIGFRSAGGESDWSINAAGELVRDVRKAFLGELSFADIPVYSGTWVEARTAELDEQIREALGKRDFEDMRRRHKHRLHMLEMGG